jgi:hypothetical protein
VLHVAAMLVLKHLIGDSLIVFLVGDEPIHHAVDIEEVLEILVGIEIIEIVQCLVW